LVNGVLDLAKIEAGRIEVAAVEFEVGSLLNEVAGILRPAAEANEVATNIEVEDGLGVVRADELRIRQCLFNLLGNAIKFSGGGTVSVAATTANEHGQDYLVFEVADTGIGMTFEQVERVFQPFEQADNSTTRKYGGTGLGLSIVRGLSRALGADVSATSVLGEGSVFTLRIPAEIGAESVGWGEDRLSSADAA
jgi:signal transduction histidine kinase